MSRFLLLPIFFALGAWLTLGYLVWRIPPSSPLTIAAFLVILFLAVFLTLAFAIYLLRSYLGLTEKTPRETFRGTFLPSLWWALAVVIYMLLRIWRAATFLNALLLIALFALITFATLRKVRPTKNPKMAKSSGR